VLEVPGNPTNIAAEPQVNADSINPGAANEQTQINMNSGEETGQGVAAVVQASSRSNDGTVASNVNLIGDVTETTLVDGNVYRLGDKEYTASNITVNSTGSITLLTVGPLAAGGKYHIRGWALYLGSQAAGAPVFSWGASGGLALGAIQDGWQDFEGGGVSPVIHNNVGALGAVTGPGFAAATTNWLYRFDIEINVTTTGSLNITGSENTAGDAFVVSRIYAWLEPN
jgi:hypothetical protein